MPRKGKGKGPGGDDGTAGRGGAGGGNGGEGPPEEGGEGRGTGGGKEGKKERWKEVEELVRRLEPEIVQIFRRHQIDPNLASLVLEEVVTLLLYRWGQIARPEAWILEMLERRLERQRPR